jgi:hypothetical protein
LTYPSGKHTKNYGKSPFLMGKSTISMAMFNSYVKITRGYFSQYMEKNGKIIQMFQPTTQPGVEAAKTSDLFGKTKTSDLSQNQKI